MRAELIGVVVSAAALGVGCAGAAKPVDQLANTEAAVRAAQELGAEQQPQAELHMTLAREEIQRAHELMKDDENEQAARVLARAKADAELALAITRRAEAKSELNQAQSGENAAGHTVSMAQ